MVKLLGGYHEPDKDSEAMVMGQPFQLGSMVAARETGLRFVHQDLGLIEHFTVAENFFMAAASSRLRPLAKRDERVRTSRALRDFGYGDINPESLVSELSAAQRTVVAIVRALSGDAPPALLVLDEPTASLPGPDASCCSTRCVDSPATGDGALISHHLDEIMRLADSVTVLREAARWPLLRLPTSPTNGWPS